MDKKNLLVLSMVKGIGPVFIKKNRNRLLLDCSCNEIISEFRPEEKENLDDYAKAADEIIADCETNDIKIISIIDESYPSLLYEIGNPPSVLFMKGNEALLKNAIAIIGTRHSSDLGNKIAERVGGYFSEKFSICNGLVEGIDEHSIYNKGLIRNKVIGIISGGLLYKETCSANHIRIIDDVLNAGGLVVSEFYPRQKEDRYFGIKASRIQAGVSRGLILVQSKIDGGSKYTLGTFAKLSRPIGIIHYPQSEEYNTDVFGANRLIVEQGKGGLAQMIGIKKSSSLNIGNIVVLTGKNDYEKFSQDISASNENSLF